MTRLLAYADVHLGSGAKYGVKPGDRLADQAAALERIVDLAIDRQVDAVLNAGDTFHGPAVAPEEYAVFQTAFRRLKEAGIPHLVCLGNGKHDCAMRDVSAPAVIADVAEVFTAPSLRIVGDTYVAILPWVHYGRLVAEADGGNRGEIMVEAAEKLIDVARGLRAGVPDGAPCVLMTHFSISGAALPNGLPVADLREPILPLVDLESQGWDAVVAGHIHRRQFLSSGTFDIGPIVFYTGSLLPVDFSEATLDHGATIIDVYADGTVDTEFVPVESRPFVDLTCDLTDGGDLNHTIACDYDGAVVKLSYRATAEQERRIDHGALERAILEAGASKVYAIVATIERDTRARIKGVDEGMAPLDALRAWTLANDVTGTPAEQLDTLTEGYLARIGATAASVSGGLTPLLARARNYRSFSDVEFQFPYGLVAMVGSNGAGKSSVINLVDLCLFAGRGELADLIRTGEDDMEISLVFESGGETYRVRRGLRRGKSQTVDLEIAHTDMGPNAQESWEPISRESADATNRAIVEITGLTRATFRASVYLRQRDRSSFTDCGAAARKATLIEIIGLEEWEQLLTLAKADLAEAQTQIAELDRSIELAEHAVGEKSTVEAQLAEARARAESAAGVIATAEAAIEAAQTHAAAAASGAERVRALEAEFAAARTVEEALRARLSDAALAEDARKATQLRLVETAQVAEGVAELEARVAELRGMKAKADAALAERAAIEREALTLRADVERRGRDLRVQDSALASLRQKARLLREHDDDSQTCDRCEQHLGAEARVRALASYDTEIADVARAVADETGAVGLLAIRAKDAADRAEQVSVPEVVDPAPVEAELVKARAAVEARASLTAQLQAHAERAAGLPRLQEEHGRAAAACLVAEQAVADAKSGLVDTAAFEAEIATARNLIAGTRAAAQAATELIGRSVGQLEQIAAAETKLVDDTADREQWRARADLLHVACRAYGRDGVPALIVENSAIPQLEETINRLLREFETSYTVELRTQRERKNDTLAETLDIVVYDRDSPRPLETGYSEGEQSVIALCCRLALEELLRSYGRRSSVLMIDEIEFLSQERQLLMVDVLRGILDQFDAVLLITHSPVVAESCDRQIRFVKHDDVSRIDTATLAPVELEAVAA